MNAIVLRCFYATAASLATGAVLIFIIAVSKKNEVDVGQLLKKFFVYWLIIAAMEAGIYFNLAPYIFPGIIFIAFFEMIRVAVQNRKPGGMLIFSLLIFMLFGSGFIFFSREKVPLVLCVYVLVVVFDGFSQLTGILFGKRKLAPRISPGKTWEGFAGGFLAAALVTMWTLADFRGLVVGAVVSVFALLGDLLASKYKRVCGVKDYSALVPFHGGVLDRFDSFIVAGAITILAEWILYLIVPIP